MIWPWRQKNTPTETKGRASSFLVTKPGPFGVPGIIDPKPYEGFFFFHMVFFEVAKPCGPCSFFGGWGNYLRCLGGNNYNEI